MKLEYYATRAHAAHAAAEAAIDPRDKAAFRAAAQTWERLAKPAEDTYTYSLEPMRRDIDALKKDVAVSDNPRAAPVAPPVKRVTERVSRVDQFSAVDEYLRSGIEF